MHKNLSDTGRKSKPNRQISDRYQDTGIGRFTSLNCLCDVLLLCCFCLHCHPSRRFWALSPSEIRIFVSFLVLFSSSYAFFGGCDTFCDSRQSEKSRRMRSSPVSGRQFKPKDTAIASSAEGLYPEQKTNTVLAANNTYSRIKTHIWLNKVIFCMEI